MMGSHKGLRWGHLGGCRGLLLEPVEPELLDGAGAEQGLAPPFGKL